MIGVKGGPAEVCMCAVVLIILSLAEAICGFFVKTLRLDNGG